MIKTVSVYVALIINGVRSFDSIPTKLKDAVKEELKKLGFDENGQPLKEDE